MPIKIPGPFRLSDGRWRWVVYYKDEFGVTQQKEFAAKDKAKGRKRVVQWIDAIEAGYRPEDPTVSEICQQAIDEAVERNLAPKTIDGYRDYLRLHIGPTIGSVKIKQLQPAHVERMCRLMMEGKTWVKRTDVRNNKAYEYTQEPSDAQSALLVRNFLRMAINKVGKKRRIVDFNAAEMADPPKNPPGKVKRVRKRLTPAQLDLIVDKEEDPVLRVAWLLLGTTGLRPVEARGLLLADLFEADGRWFLTVERSKTEAGEGRIVPLGSRLKAAIDAMPKRGLFLLTTSKGTQYDESNLRRAWIKAMTAAEIEYTNQYQTRKLYASRHVRKGTDDVMLRNLMGHTDIRTTKQYYTGVTLEDLKDVAIE